MHYVYSTLTSSVEYADWQTQGTDLPRKGRSVIIKGGAGVATKTLETPRGFVTQVDDDELAILERNKVFQTHVERGFITVEPKAYTLDTIIDDMSERDKSAPLRPVDFDKNENGPKPIKNKKK